MEDPFACAMVIVLPFYYLISGCNCYDVHIKSMCHSQLKRSLQGLKA